MKEQYAAFYCTLLEKADTQREDIDSYSELKKVLVCSGNQTQPAWTECCCSTTANF